MDNRPVYVAGAAVLLVIAAAFLVSDTGPDQKTATGAETGTEWRSIELTDVRTGETFTVESFDKPVLVESFAVWCPTCTRQQEEMKKLHDQVGDNIVSVSLNTDPNEREAKVRNHIQRHGFDWYYAVAPPEMTQSLIDSYGPSVVNAPLSPKILVCRNGTAHRLPNGVMPADTLQSTVEEKCGGI